MVQLYMELNGELEESRQACAKEEADLFEPVETNDYNAEA